MDLQWQLLFGRSYNFRSYGLKWGKKKIQLFKVYNFVKIAI